MLVLTLLGSISLAPAQAAELTPQALSRQGRFSEAVAAWRAILVKNPASGEAHAGLVLDLLRLDDVKAAEEAASRALATLPQAALVRAVRGDVFFRKGMPAAAESEYRAALRFDDRCARAWLGMGRIEAAVSHRDHARAAFEKARQFDPEDGDALYRSAALSAFPQNVTLLEDHLARYRTGPERERREHEYIAFIKALAGRKIWTPPADAARAEIKLDNIATPAGVRGAGVHVKFNGGPPHLLLLDTGASWITVPRKLAEKAGARKLSDFGMEGTGDAGPAAGYYAWVEKISIGDIEFRDCVIQVTLKENSNPEEGTLGLQMFTPFLVTLDLPAHRLRLSSLPETAPGPRDDSTRQLIAPDTAEQSQRQFLSFGHLILLPVRVNDKAEGLFILDTGANTTSVSASLAKQVTALQNSKMRVTGASGEVNDVFLAPDIRLRFAGKTETAEDMQAFDRPALSRSLETEVSGLIGLPALTHRKIVINYRDGVVRFE
jgi:predicted aspartyl protease